MKSDYHERKEARIDRYNKRASKAKTESTNAFENASELGSAVPFGQPILVGHHSEGAHRSLIKKIDRSMRKSIDEQEKAEYYTDKAKSAKNSTAISSDNPDAIQLLKEKIAKLEAERDKMKNTNAAWRIYDKKGDDSKLKELGFTDDRVNKFSGKYNFHMSDKKELLELFDCELSQITSNKRVKK